ncbi:PH domain leucine-rich repeat-containing protein phosphatase 2-like isoform X2 [Watersipora subatra]|uniref:PH domain leucine-rich repeat-containing protein phosphatase 2-like isoform X2 n=1 Tax=Watersipora subatra TaxID=2589382 RepID=UPI00355B52B7
MSTTGYDEAASFSAHARSLSAQELELYRGSQSNGRLSGVSNGHYNQQGILRQASSESRNSHSGLQRSESYQGQTQEWWSVNEHMKPRGVQKSSHQQMGMSLAARIFNQQCEENWDLSDSLADLYLAHDIINKKSWSTLATFRPPSNLENIDRDKWLAADTSHGFIRVYPPDSTAVSEVGAKVVPCSIAMEAHSICQAIGVAPNSLHVQFGGDLIRRLDPYEHPLVLQNEYLSKIGYHDVYRIQLESLSVDLGYLIRFYSGKPFFDNTFSRNHLSAYLDVKLGGVLSRWCKRLCTLSGTQIKIYKDKSDNGTAQVIQLSNGCVEECKSKTHPHYLKLSTQSTGPEKSIFLSFDTFTDYSKWLKKCRKAVAKLPANADLSNCNLEFLPETLFINGQLSMLNLRHNALRHRPTEEDIYTIGWLEDLPRFQCLRSLNLADNNLETFPNSICEMHGLVELNLGCNKIESIPSSIGDLVNLQAFHLHNNHLSGMPNEILQLKKLVILVLAFNKFHQIPPSVAQLTDVRTSECETIIMAGNLIDSISSEVITKLKHAKKVDLRMNNLSLPASETVYMSELEQLTHLDLRMNKIRELDLRCVKALEYLNVERNELHSLQLNGSQLKTVFASYNEVQQFLVNPKPEWLEILDLSYNKLEKLPEWLSDCNFLKRLNISHNKLQTLPQRLFSDAQKLKQLIADHNEIRELPNFISHSILEEINLHHNRIDDLPDDFLCKLNKLKILNLSTNALTFLPPLNEIEDLNKVQELYLTQNCLQDDCLEVIAGYHRLKILHLAYNEITCMDDSFAESVELLQELNIAGNRMRSLPSNLVNMPELKLLRAHSNLLKTLPDLTESSALKVLDVACNKLLSISASELASSSQLHSLDMQMTQFSVDKTQMEVVKKAKQIKSVDSSGENKELSSLATGSDLSLYKMPRICQLGFAETSGSRNNRLLAMGCSETNGQRNKLCVTVLHQLSYKDKDEALFAMFDGGRNSEVPKILKKVFPSILAEEMTLCNKPSVYLKYSFLQAHKALKNAGQYLGSSALVCHIRRSDDSSRQFYINIANCGDVAAVLCRAGEAIVLSQSHTVVDDREEVFRIFRSDGIITEDNRVNGTSVSSRALGNCYLYPQLIPEPHVMKKTLRSEDQFMIIANSSLWRFVSHKEAVEEIQYLANPVVAAKRLQDLAQGYGCKENVSVLVIQFNGSVPSSASSMSNLSTASEGVVFHTLPSNKDKALKVKKRPIPAPRAGSAAKLSLSSQSSLGEMSANIDLSYVNLAEGDAERSGDNSSEQKERKSYSIMRQKKVQSQPRPRPRHSQPQMFADEPDSDVADYINVSELLISGSQTSIDSTNTWELTNGGVPVPNFTDSTATLTGMANSDVALDSFEKQLVKTPLYSSDTRLMEFVDSTSTLNSFDTNGDQLYPPLAYPKNRLHQSDTRLLNPAHIELKSTNYFTRPPLSCSSMEEEPASDCGDYMYIPPSGYTDELGGGSQSTLCDAQSISNNSLCFTSGRPKSRRERIYISGQSFQSPDGSYFSIESEEDAGFNLYENIAALRMGSQMMSTHYGCTTPQADDLIMQSHDSHETSTRIHQISLHGSNTTSLHSHSMSPPTIHAPSFCSHTTSPNGSHTTSSSKHPPSSPNVHAPSSRSHILSAHNSQTNLGHDLTPTNSTHSLGSRQSAEAQYGNHSQIFYHDSSLRRSSIDGGEKADGGVANRRLVEKTGSGNRYSKLSSSSMASKSIMTGTNNNIHHNSNGSSAYGSGSLAISHESDIDTYL